MLYYHFTALENLDAIRAEGITRGEVPLSMARIRNGVWLTTDRDPAGHGLSGGDEPAISGAALISLKARGWIARDIPDDAEIFSSNKRAVRLTVKLNSNDSDLVYWMKWGRKNLAANWFDTLNKVGGGNRKAKTWYISFRAITPSEITNIEILDERL